MRLKDWMTAHTRTLEQLAPEVGCNMSNLSKIVRGLVWVSGDVAENIRRATNGQVTPEDLHDAWREAEDERRDRRERSGKTSSVITP